LHRAGHGAVFGFLFVAPLVEVLQEAWRPQAVLKDLPVGLVLPLQLLEADQQPGDVLLPLPAVLVDVLVRAALKQRAVTKLGVALE
jgi:hypothetical protein